MNEALLAQFSLANEQIDRVGGRMRDNDGNNVADEGGSEQE